MVHSVVFLYKHSLNQPALEEARNEHLKVEQTQMF